MAIFDFGLHHRRLAEDQRRIAEAQRRLAEDALAITDFARSKDAAVADLLRVLAQRFDAFGAVLWELTGKDLTDVRLDELIPRDEWRLFTVASWFDCDGPPFAMHNLPLFGSKTGDGLRQGKPLVEHDLPRNGGRMGQHALLRKHQAIQMICVPIYSRTEDGRPRVQSLNLYRTARQPWFTESDAERLQYNATLVNSILNAIEDSRAVRIVAEIDSILLSDPGDSTEGPLQTSMLRLKNCCNTLGQLLNCCEVSLFLSRQRDGDEFLLPITTLDFTLKPISETGLTRWVLNRRRGIRILDLMKFKEDKSEIRKEYHDDTIDWTDSGNVRKFAKDELGIDDERDLPPLSFMATPLIVDIHRYGVVRCSVRGSGPTYFSDRDLKMLGVVANRLALTWRDAILQDALFTERGAWERLAKLIGELNAKLQSDETPTRPGWIQQALNEIPQILPQVDIVDVRLATNDKKSLMVTGASGPGLLGLTQESKNRFFRTLFPLGGPPYASVGSEVYDTRKALQFPDVFSAASFAHLSLLATKEMVVVPIESGNEIYGVLDFHRTTGNEPLPKTVLSAASILGSQIGLYLRMHDAFEKEKATLEERDRTYQDLGHQLKTPLTSLTERVTQAIDWLSKNTLREEALVRIRGMARQSLVVSHSLQLLADLNRGIPIKPTTARVTAAGLRQTLIELASDAQAQLAPGRKIHINVDRTWLFDEDSFKKIPIFLDWKLLRQCVTNLLDNAGKYSKSGTTIEVVTGIDYDGLQIRVVNRGIRIDASEVDLVRLRDWRSPAAKRVTGEGQGIGLWIVDKVMQAHRGKLKIVPTNIEGFTIVELIFPPDR